MCTECAHHPNPARDQRDPRRAVRGSSRRRALSRRPASSTPIRTVRRRMTAPRHGPTFDPAALIAVTGNSLRTVARRIGVDPANLCRPLSPNQADRYTGACGYRPRGLGVGVVRLGAARSRLVPGRGRRGAGRATRWLNPCEVSAHGSRCSDRRWHHATGSLRHRRRPDRQCPAGTAPRSPDPFGHRGGCIAANRRRTRLTERLVFEVPHIGEGRHLDLSLGRGPDRQAAHRRAR